MTTKRESAMYRVLTAMLLTALVGMTVALTMTSPQDPHDVILVQDQRSFEGVGRCKTCHKKPEQGEQFRLWSEGRHAKAFETLASEEAAAIAAEKGIENPQTADECLTCHVTAHGVAEELLGKRFKVEDGVGCESCHGAGGDYYKKKTMKALFAGEIEPESVGLVVQTEEVCTACHNEESPTFKEFNFEERVKEIAHPIPEGGAAAADEEG